MPVVKVRGSSKEDFGVLCVVHVALFLFGFPGTGGGLSSVRGRNGGTWARALSPLKPNLFN